MEAKSINPSDEGNYMRPELQSNMPKDMVNNSQEEDHQSQELATILRQIISQFVKKFRAMRRAKLAENVTVSPITEPQKNGKKLKNPVVAEQAVSFCLPEDCNIASFKDIDKVQSKLGDWKIQSRQRKTKMCDTYYYHKSSGRTLRSMTEVVNYILPESYQKVPNRKRSKGQEVKKSKKLKKRLSPRKNSQHTEDKKEDLELENNSKEVLQSLPEVQTRVEHEHETHVEATINMESSIDVESKNISVREEPHKYQKLEDIPNDFSVHDSLINTYFD